MGVDRAGPYYNEAHRPPRGPGWKTEDPTERLAAVIWDGTWYRRMRWDGARWKHYHGWWPPATWRPLCWKAELPNQRPHQQHGDGCADHHADTADATVEEANVTGG